MQEENEQQLSFHVFSAGLKEKEWPAACLEQVVESWQEAQLGFPDGPSSKEAPPRQAQKRWG